MGGSAKIRGTAAQKISPQIPICAVGESYANAIIIPIFFHMTEDIATSAFGELAINTINKYLIDIMADPKSHLSEVEALAMVKLELRGDFPFLPENIELVDTPGFGHDLKYVNSLLPHPLPLLKWDTAMVKL